jgi:sugar lactone lactonase YvrE
MGIGHRARLAGIVAVLALAVAAPSAARADVLATWGDSSALSHEVRGVAVAPDGDVYVADPATSRISVFTRDGAHLRTFGGFGSGPAEFVGLYGLAIGPDGDVYASDATSVQRLSPDGAFKARLGGWGFSPGRLRGAAGLAVAGDGTVYVADRGNRRVQAFGPDGDFERVVAADDHRPGALDLDDPRGVALAADGSILIAENEHEVVARIAPGGATTTWHAPGVVGVAVAPDGSVLAVDEHANIVRRTTVDGAPLGSLGAGAAPETQPGERLNRPAAVATDCRGAVYVADRAAQRIHVFGDAGLAAPPCVIPPPPPIPPTPPAAAAAPGPEPQSQVAGISEASPEPTLGASGVGEPVSGTVLVQKPGDRAFSQLRRRSKLPVGTTVDVTNGVVRIAFATAPEDVATYGPTQVGEFWGGQFRFFQAATGSLVDVILTGDQPTCDDSGAQTSAKTKSKKSSNSRFVWGKAKGRFRTTGNNGAATVRGTYWYTEDRCDGTLFRTREGRVDVKDFGRGETVPVTAGKRYLARVPCASRRAFDIRLLVPAGQVVTGSTVRVNGKRVRVKGGVPPTVRVDLRGRPKQRVRVRIELRLGTGETLRGVREYKTCTPRRSSGTPPRL